MFLFFLSVLVLFPVWEEVWFCVLFVFFMVSFWEDFSEPPIKTMGSLGRVFFGGKRLTPQNWWSGDVFFFLRGHFFLSICWLYDGSFLCLEDWSLSLSLQSLAGGLVYFGLILYYIFRTHFSSRHLTCYLTHLLTYLLSQLLQ